MKNSKIFSFTFAIAVLFSASAFAQDETADVNVTATVTGALSISTTDVAFGSIATGSNPDLAANANDAASSDVGAGATPGAVELSSGVSGAELLVEWNSDVTLSDGEAVENTLTFTADIYHGASQLTSGVSTITLDGSGEATLDIGGSLSSPTVAGIYTTASGASAKPLTVSFTYQ